jgi:arylamine N-acetyltransferase
MLVAERLTPAARFNLVDTRFTERRLGAAPVERMLETAGAFGAVLDEVFGIEPPVPAAAVFAKLTSK